MELEEYTVKNTSELEGTLHLVITHDGNEYTVEFDFQRRSNPPHTHSPFPSAAKEIYAWPAEEIPDELQFEAGTDEAAVLVFGIGLPEDINLLPKPYNEVDTGNRSPFIIYPDES